MTDTKLRVLAEDASPPSHSPAIQRLLDQPAMTEEEIAAMSPADRAEAERRGLAPKTRSAIEVWLTQKNIEITCMVVYEDEHTENLDVDSLSMRGAQREMTGYFKKQGYEPVGRWEDGDPALAGEVVIDAGPQETFRRFRPVS